MPTSLSVSCRAGGLPLSSFGGGVPPGPTDYDLLIDALRADGGWFWDFTRQDVLFQDPAGSVPVTTLDQTVGMALSVERGMELGPELWVGSAPSIENTAGSSGAYDIPSRTMTNSGDATVGYPRFAFNLSLVAGRIYYVKGKLSGAIGQFNPTTPIRLSTAGGANNVPYNFSTGEFEGHVVAGGNAIQFLTSISNTQSLVIDNISVKEVQTSGLIQATSANRPAWKQGAGVLFDGSNDGLAGAANFDFSGTDEVMVVAGLRKLSDAATGQVVELSTSNATNDGAFTLWAPGSAAPRLDFASKGTALSTSTFNNALVAAPVNAVLSGQGKISTDTAILRIDGIQRAAPTADQGSGNYGNYPLYVGRRAGALTPFNGYLTSLCVIPYLDTDLLALAESVAFTLNEGLPT